MGIHRHPLCESSVCVYRQKYTNGKILTTRHPFFYKSENVQIFTSADKVVLQLATSVTLGKTFDIYTWRNTNRCLYLALDIPPGRYKIDPEETSEDQLVFYFEDKIEEKCNEDLKEEVV